MHPILADRRRLALYLVVWGVLSGFFAVLALQRTSSGPVAAVLATLPPALVLAFVCLTAWYPVRALPLRRSRVLPLLVTHLGASLAIGAGWLLLLRLWNGVTASAGGRVIEGDMTVFFVSGSLLYLLAVVVHYLLVEFEQAHRIERREMQVAILAREAELKTLKAQLDPHFLFNSLNSISSLCGSSPASARTLTTLLADYLRTSLRLGSSEAITLSEELELVSGYIAIERIRFGARLEVEQRIDEAARDCRVPPLLLQPLVENAVTHGIGHLIEGGTVAITAERSGDRVRISIENPCDADRPSSSGSGIGLANTRRRLEVFYDRAARLELQEDSDRFRITLTVPHAATPSGRAALAG